MCKAKSKSNTLSKNGLKLLSFNIEGLASGLEDPNFIDLMYKHDICLLSETWKRDESKINLPGWWDFSQVRPKHKKAGRHSGVSLSYAKRPIGQELRFYNHQRVLYG